MSYNERRCEKSSVSAKRLQQVHFNGRITQIIEFNRENGIQKGVQNIKKRALVLQKFIIISTIAAGFSVQAVNPVEIVS